MQIDPSQALSSVEKMLRRAADSLRSDNGRHDVHQMLFTVMAEVLPTEVLHNNIVILIDMLKKGLTAPNEKVQEASLTVINTLLATQYNLKDVEKILSNENKEN